MRTVDWTGPHADLLAHKAVQDAGAIEPSHQQAAGAAA